jgi:UV DNA damage endonuclease
VSEPGESDLVETFAKIMATWHADQQPKIHFSSPRTEMHEKITVDKTTRKKIMKPVAPMFTGPADFCNPFEFATFMRLVADFDFDVMLEAKAKDLALVRLRWDLLRYAPDVAERFGVAPQSLATFPRKSPQPWMTTYRERVPWTARRAPANKRRGYRLRG